MPAENLTITRNQDHQQMAAFGCD